MTRDNRRALTLTALALIALGTYLVDPQFVAGLLWDTLNTAVTYWVES
jgi:hypothetical protein